MRGGKIIFDTQKELCDINMEFYPMPDIDRYRENR